MARESVEFPCKIRAPIPDLFYIGRVRIYLPQWSAVILIDDEDLPIFGPHRWRVQTNHHCRYVSRRDGDRTVMLHRLIVKAPKGKVVDHINGNGLDNRKENLRIVTHRQNLWNRPRDEGMIGVSKSKRAGIWRATIDHDGRKLDLGTFLSLEDAQAARDLASRMLRGPTATQNFPEADYSSFDLLKISPAARRILLAAS